MKYIVVLALFFVNTVCLCDTAEAQTSSQTESGPFPYAMTVEALRQRRALNSAMFLVDVRSPEAFERTSIQNSLNIPLFAVKSKDFVKTQPLVLLDEGFRPASLNSSCAQLRDAGFDAWFLLGGLNAWHVSGGELRGDVFAQRDLNQISAQQVFLEHPVDGWLVVDASRFGNEGMVSPFPHTQFMPFIPDQSARFLSELQQRIRQHMSKFSEAPLMLLYTQDGAEYAQIERALADHDLPPLFFLKGGLHAYTQLMTQQDAIGNGPQEVSTKCAPCAR